jgi:hypothetical protein
MPLALVLYYMNMSLSPALSFFAPSLRSFKVKELGQGQSVLSAVVESCTEWHSADNSA